jgi:hypothetical protein
VCSVMLFSTQSRSGMEFVMDTVRKWRQARLEAKLGQAHGGDGWTNDKQRKRMYEPKLTLWPGWKERLNGRTKPWNPCVFYY